MTNFQIQLGSDWQDLSPEEDAELKRAWGASEPKAFLTSRGQKYEIIFASMEQRNLETGKTRKIRAPHRWSTTRPAASSRRPVGRASAGGYLDAGGPLAATAAPPQPGAAAAPAAINPGLGDFVPLSDAGCHAVLHQGEEAEVAAFVRRVLHGEGVEVVDEVGLLRFVRLCKAEKASLTFEQLRTTLQDKARTERWLRPISSRVPASTPSPPPVSTVVPGSVLHGARAERAGEYPPSSTIVPPTATLASDRP